jgi:hypothetical protein
MSSKRFIAAGALLAMLAFGVSVAVAATGQPGSTANTSSTTTGAINHTPTTTTTGTTTATTTTTTRHRQKPVKPGTRPAAHPFAPDTLRGAPEVSGVILDATTHQFKQVVFDRGRVTAVTSDSITLRQQQAGVAWRTQTFSVPSTATVTLAGHTATLANIPVGAVARVESSGAVGGSVAVVRINAIHRGVVTMPTTNP